MRMEELQNMRHSQHDLQLLQLYDSVPCNEAVLQEDAKLPRSSRGMHII